MASNILKFHPSNLITGINIIDDMLFFTDGVNEPKKIDLDIFRAADHSSGNTVVYGRNFQERDITVTELISEFKVFSIVLPFLLSLESS